MKQFRVPVLQEHIDNGKPGDANYCPIALAFKDAGYSPVVVTEMKIHFKMDGFVYTMPVILEVEQFIFGNYIENFQPNNKKYQ